MSSRRARKTRWGIGKDRLVDHLESSVEFDSTVGYSRVFFEASCQIVRT